VSCAKKVTLIEMQSGMLSYGSREHVLYGDVDAPWEWAPLGCLSNWKGL